MSSLPRAPLKQRTARLTIIRILRAHIWMNMTESCSLLTISVLVLWNVLLNLCSSCAMTRIKIRSNQPLCYSLLLCRILFHSPVISNHCGGLQRDMFKTLPCLQFTLMVAEGQEIAQCDIGLIKPIVICNHKTSSSWHLVSSSRFK